VGKVFLTGWMPFSSNIQEQVVVVVVVVVVVEKRVDGR